MEIIVFIMNEMRTDHLVMDRRHFNLLSKKLTDNGYTESEITNAVTWVLEKVSSEVESKKELPVQHSYRILHDFEKLTISPEAYGYLIQLRELDLINDMEMEQVIDKAMLADLSPVTLATMKEIVAETIFRPADLIEGSFFLLDNISNVH